MELCIQPALVSTERIAPLDPSEVESLVFNLQTACQVHKPSHFYNWSQGVLQSLISHELLLCFSTTDSNPFERCEPLSTLPLAENELRKLPRREPEIFNNLLDAWRENRGQAMLVGINAPALANSVLAREMHRMDADTLLVHGISSPDGKTAGFYLFLCQSRRMRSRQAYLSELIMPVLHAALMRTRVEEIAGSQVSGGNETRLLTRREQEVLKWICLGKSNIEIGMILGISRLTVKNHVQEILRRLNVLNRAQAVGKAMSLHLIAAD